MSLAKTLEQLEDKYFGELEEDKDAILAELSELHKEALKNGLDDFRAFAQEVMPRFGGVYIPYICWVELREFIRDNDKRTYMFDLIGQFVTSNFEDEEKKKMKPLLITYFALEKEFELNKIDSKLLSDSHPLVKEYFRKLAGFVEKNKTSVDMYIEKFNLLQNLYPDFGLLRMPVIKLKEKLAAAE